MALRVHDLRKDKTPVNEEHSQATRPFPYRAAVVLVEAVFAYEWLVSAVDKLLSGMFFLHLQRQLEDAVSGSKYTLYARFLQTIVPHSHLLAILVVSGELSVGLGFVILMIGTLRYRGAPSPTFLWLGAVVTFTGTLMNVNFFFFQNGAYFLNPQQPFDEGVPIDFCMAVIQLELFVLHAMALRHGEGRSRHPNET
ncbi:MAG: hypothetical protein K6T78_10530 [Alicyclobacillus sp.]|nr:hypothetical protein [Alicyclobacillus sp.]